MTNFRKDSENDNFLAADIALKPDRFGECKATLVYKPAPGESKKAVLYIHGFIDYFFQWEMAEFFNNQGFNFFAIDLRRYGRSLSPGEKHPNIIEAMEDYYEELDRAMDIIRDELKNEFVVVTGHSTGGLLASLYAADRPQKVNAVILNSPFFDFNIPLWKRLIILPLVNLLHGVMPAFGVDSLTEVYPKSVHKDHYGEWDFNLKWKPIENFPAFFAWLNAIRQGHKRVHNGLNISVPVLLLHSDKSYFGTKYSPEAQVADAVLNVQHMIDNEKNIGPNVTRMVVKDGMHDLALSKKEPRETFYRYIGDWIKEVEII